MVNGDTLERSAELEVRNIGGIEETTVSLSPGITVLTGRNATNRTSFLRSIMAVLGSDDTSLKADAERGRVQLRIGDEQYVRTLERTNGTVTAGGSPYLEAAELADLFAFLLESNAARRAVERGDDLRELIMRPVDTDAIESEIQRLDRERSRIDDELDDLSELKRELPSLEERRRELEDEIETKRSKLATKEDAIDALDADVDETRAEQQRLESQLQAVREKRSELEQVRSDIDLQQESIESLTAERRELEAELSELPETPMAEYEDLEDEITRLRTRKETLEADVSDLQDVIQFNEDQLEERSDSIAALRDGDDGAVTDALVEDTVVCWTCGSEVDEERITETVAQLRRVRREKLDTVRSLESELSERREEKRAHRQQQQRKQTVERKLADVETEIDDREEQLEDLRSKRERLGEEIGTLESEIEDLESDDFSEVLDLHKEANQLEFELGQLESTLDDVTARIETVEERLAEESRLQSRREDIEAELTDLRTRVDQIEASAVEQFNEHMHTVLDVLDYDNLERIWIEAMDREVRDGRQTVEQTVFELHIVRSTNTGATYEDTIDHLSESEREVTGLVFALAGYLVHDVHETVPFVLLDSLEAIDSERIAALVEYIAEYAPFLVVALLPEDAQALDEQHPRITSI